MASGILNGFEINAIPNVVTRLTACALLLRRPDGGLKFNYRVASSCDWLRTCAAVPNLPDFRSPSGTTSKLAERGVNSASSPFFFHLCLEGIHVFWHIKASRLFSPHMDHSLGEFCPVVTVCRRPDFFLVILQVAFTTGVLTYIVMFTGWLVAKRCTWALGMHILVEECQNLCLYYETH